MKMLNFVVLTFLSAVNFGIKCQQIKHYHNIYKYHEL
jgi:hypothetical protein